MIQYYFFTSRTGSFFMKGQRRFQTSVTGQWKLELL